MDFFQAIFLGVLQGLAEWLPVSSQGQIMVAALAVFEVSVKEATQYSISLHVGTLIAAIAYFRKEWEAMLQFKEKRLFFFLTIAVFASAITGVPTYLFFRQAAQQALPILVFVGLGLVVTGFVQMRKAEKHDPELSASKGIVLGLAQGFSVLPGISRSGITTSILLFQGYSPSKALRYSFLLSVPSVLLAEIVFGLQEGFPVSLESFAAIAVAAVVGYHSMRLLIDLAKQVNFGPFCVAFGMLYMLIGAYELLG